MGLFDALLARPGPEAEQRAAAEARSPSPSDDGRASLERRRDELVAQVAELNWDLGGLTYEMAIRDHFRLDVLVRKAAELQERDAELGELERVLSLQEHAGASACPDCGAVHGRGALYCWQCGKVLMERVPSAAANGSGSEAGGSERPASSEARGSEHRSSSEAGSSEHRTASEVGGSGHRAEAPIG